MTRNRANPPSPRRSGDREDDDDAGESEDRAAGERKERVIHTRVPERLEAHLRLRADDLGISVSNLVRNVLGHAFGLVGGVVADSHAVARAARGERAAPPPAPAAPSQTPPSQTPPPPPPAHAPAPAPTSIDDVLGWQPIVLGKNAVCARCNAILPRGKDAAVGVGSQLVICPACLEELRT